jgi:hypothetical protein
MQLLVLDLLAALDDFLLQPAGTSRLGGESGGWFKRREKVR